MTYGEDMMKKCKIAAALLAALMITACGSTEEAAENTVETVEAQAVAEPAETESTDAEDGEPLENTDAYDEAEEVKKDAAFVLDRIKSGIELPEMYEADDAHIINNYGIDPSELDSYAVCEALEVTLADKIILIDPADGADTAAIKDKLESFRQDKISEMEDYLPELVDVISAASVKEVGDFIILVISPDAEKIENLINEALTE